jgi:hypothetical protein
VEYKAPHKLTLSCINKGLQQMNFEDVMQVIRLSSYGYTDVAKGTPAHYVKYLEHEAKVYDRLRSIQGKQVPVHLGNFDLVRPYHYDDIVDLVHMMLLGYGDTFPARNKEQGTTNALAIKVDRSIAAIHALGVLSDFVGDAKRFIMQNLSIIEQALLQLYLLAIVFAVENSTVRHSSRHLVLRWI